MKGVSLTVSIRVNDDGTLWATHAPTTESDAATLAGMRFGGQDVVARALMGEAVRRQSHLMVGLVQATDPARTLLMKNGDPKEISEVVTQTLSVLTEVAEKSVPFAVSGAIKDLMGAKTSDSV